MKVKEVTVSLSGVIAIASYENLRPGYSMTCEIEKGDDVRKMMRFCQDYLHGMMDEEANRGKSEYLMRAYDNFRFYEKDGRRYISVTTVLSWDTDWHVTPDRLAQLAARGTIVGEISEFYLETGEWLDPEKCDKLASDVALLKTGDLSWNDCSHVAFMEKYAKDIVVEKTQGTVFNDEQMYAGTYDVLGTFEGVKSIMDFKCGGHNMAQLAAYAVCVPDVKRLVVLPVGPTDNKCGYKKPIVCDDIQGEFEKFLQARAKFRKAFGI